MGIFTLDGTLLGSASVNLFLFLFGPLTSAVLVSSPGINDVHNAVLKSGARMPGKFSSSFVLPFFSWSDDAIFLPFVIKTSLEPCGFGKIRN